MRGFLIATCCVAALAVVTTPSLSMGGGGGGGGMGGGYSGSGGSITDDYTIAVRLIKHEKYQDAIPHLLMALADKPTNADILNYLGFTKRMTGDYPASLDYYRRALAINPGHKGAHEYLGELYLQMNDPDSAKKELDTLAGLCPSGCDERDTLEKKIAAYVPAAAPAAAPAASN